MSELRDTLHEMFTAVLAGMGLEGTVTVSQTGPGEHAVDIAGDDLDALIGREGSVIDALQYLAHQTAVRAAGGEAQRVSVDAAGYRDRRRRQLERLAAHAASEAIEHGEEIELDAMTPHDRRIVHMALAERDDIVTRSEGDEPNRRIVVLPASLAEE